MKRILKILAILALCAGIYVAGVLVYGTVTDYNPPDLMAITPVGEAAGSADSLFTFVTWNIGYTGQGARADFFYDGGKQVIASDADVTAYRDGITQFLSSETDVDVFFLQEVDSSARRSYYVNQPAHFLAEMPDYLYAFASNYRVQFVPMPLFNPMGKVISGLSTFSRLPADGFERHAFDTQFSWPTRIFFLDRCFLTHRTPLSNGRDLVCINTHCSAYDTSGTMVSREIERIMSFAEAEYQKGNYIVIGGDWNQCPPGYTPLDTNLSYNEHILRDDQLPQGWRWEADINVYTNRKLSTPYNSSSYKSVIDHFVVSPNLETVLIEGIDLDFAFSDHQPVKLTVKLKDVDLND